MAEFQRKYIVQGKGSENLWLDIGNPLADEAMALSAMEIAKHLRPMLQYRAIVVIGEIEGS